MERVLAALLELAKELLPSIAAYFAGKKAEKQAAEHQALEAVSDARKIENTVDGLSDDEFKRLRDKYSK